MDCMFSRVYKHFSPFGLASRVQICVEMFVNKKQMFFH